MRANRDEGKSCPTIAAKGWILLVSSQRGVTSAPPSTAHPEI